MTSTTSVITGTIEILAEAVADRPDLAAIAGLIAEAAARGAGLTSHLLAFAHGQPSQPRDVDISALLIKAARLLRPTLDDQIEIHTMPATGLSPACVDPSRLMTVILNLAISARDAMPEGGELAFETRSSAAGESNTRAGSVAAAAEHVVIMVSATGYESSADRKVRPFADLCMAEDFLAQNFLSQNFGESSDGDVRVRRRAGREAVVEIYLPAAARSPAQASSNPGIEGGDEAILVVEDDALGRGYVVTQLEGLGYMAFAAGDAGEALAIIDGGAHRRDHAGCD
jgi:hypothetical protein